MAISSEEIAKIAHLARLAVPAQDIPVYVKELSTILDLVAEMNAVDTTHIEPLAHPLDMNQRLRPDAVSERDQRTTFQSIAPAVDRGLYLVPRVVE